MLNLNKVCKVIPSSEARRYGFLNKPQARLMSIFVCVLLLITINIGLSENAYAYFDRGAVGISVGQSSVSLTSGESANISVSLSPSSDRQLPGCGMAECPQICGDKYCLDANGQCQCAGMTYQTYNTEVWASSSNSSVASASYSNGVLYVRAVSPGTATITLTAKLRQFTDSSRTVQVNVKAASPPNVGGSTPGSNAGNSSNSGSSSGNVSSGSGNSGSASSGSGSGSSNSGSSSGNVSSGSGNSGSGNNGSGNSSKSQIGGNSSVGNPQTQSSNVSSGTVITDPQVAKSSSMDEGFKRITGMDGMIYTIVNIDAVGNTSELFKDAMGKNEKITFQSMDNAGNVLYSISFLGSELTDAPDINFAANVSESLPEGIKSNEAAMILDFDEHVILPAAAEVYVIAGAQFNDKVVDVYQIKEGKSNPEKIAQDGEIVAGYLAFDIATTEDVILASGKVSSSGGFLSVLPYILAGLVVIGVITFFLIRRSKAKNINNKEA